MSGDPKPPFQSAEIVPQHEAQVAQPAKPPVNALSILEAVVNSQGGINKENVDVVERLVQLARDQRNDEAKAAFARAYFQMRKNMPEIYADKEAYDKAGNVTFTYCSEVALSKKLEPHLMSYGFAMLFGQSESNGRITVNVTLLHEQGHQEIREFTVRAGATNAMKDGAMADAGGATTAWRHLMIEMFGLKSRIQTNQQAEVEGEKITKDKVMYLQEQCRELGPDAEPGLLHLAGVEKFEQVGQQVYPVLVRAIEKRKLARKSQSSKT
jgi:hypothetical protein